MRQKLVTHLACQLQREGVRQRDVGVGRGSSPASYPAETVAKRRETERRDESVIPRKEARILAPGELSPTRQPPPPPPSQRSRKKTYSVEYGRWASLLRGSLRLPNCSLLDLRVWYHSRTRHTTYDGIVSTCFELFGSHSTVAPLLVPNESRTGRGNPERTIPESTESWKRGLATG